MMRPEMTAIRTTNIATNAVEHTSNSAATTLPQSSPRSPQLRASPAESPTSSTSSTTRERVRGSMSPHAMGNTFSALFSRIERENPGANQPTSSDSESTSPRLQASRRESLTERLSAFSVLHLTDKKGSDSAIQHNITSAFKHLDDALKASTKTPKRPSGSTHKKIAGDASALAAAAFCKLCDTIHHARLTAASGTAEHTALAAFIEHTHTRFLDKCCDVIFQLSRWSPCSQLKVAQQLLTKVSLTTRKAELETALVRSIYNLDSDEMRLAMDTQEQRADALSALPSYLKGKIAILAGIEEWEALWWDTEKNHDKEAILENAFFKLCRAVKNINAANGDLDLASRKLQKFIETKDEALIEIFQCTIATLDECSTGSQFKVWQTLANPTTISTRQDIVLCWADYAHLLKPEICFEMNQPKSIPSLRQKVLEELFGFEMRDKGLYKEIIRRLNYSCQINTCWTKEETHLIGMRFKRSSEERTREDERANNMALFTKQLEKTVEDSLGQTDIW